MSKQNVVLLSLDSLRADHLPIYGYSRDTTPNLSEFSNRSDVTVFENAFATTAWTLPSHTSMFTGLSTAQHGVYDEGFRIDPKRTLAAYMSDSGYDTAAFLNNGWLKNGGITDAFDNRFDIFNYDQPTNVIGRNLNRLSMLFSMQDSGVDQSIKHFRKWIATRNDSSPLFAFFHLMEPHYLYNPMRPYHKRYTDRSVMRSLVKQREIYTKRGKYFAGDKSISAAEMDGFVDLYDSEISYLDAKLKELFSTLRANDLFESSLIIIVGDHGELFGEHDLIGHHFSLSEELLHVPLLVKWPNESSPVESNRSESFVSLSNIFKTVTNNSAAEVPSGPSRYSLEEQHAANNKQAFAHYRTPESMLDSFREQTDHQFDYHDAYDTSISVIRNGSEKLVVTENESRYYDLDSVGGETNDRSASHQNRVEELRSRLDDYLAVEPLADSSKRGFSEGVQEQLESLGYI